MNHSKGPWGIDKGDDHETWIESEENSAICLIAHDPFNKLDKLDIANAYLISSAPEMYEILKLLIDKGSFFIIDIEVDHTIDFEEVEIKIKTILKKAEGLP